MEPSLANDADSPRPADVSAALKASMELTLPAANRAADRDRVAAPVAGVKTKVLPLSELVPASVRSATFPATASTPLPVGATRRGRLRGIAGGRLQHLVGDRLGGIDQLLQRGEAGVGRLQHLHAVTDAVEQLLMSLARLLRPCAVKKLVGLSSAELTLLPVARRFWVVARAKRCCNERRFWRTDAERTIPDMLFPFWMNTTDASPPLFCGRRATLFRKAPTCSLTWSS